MLTPHMPIASVTEIILNLINKAAQSLVCLVFLANLVSTASEMKTLSFCRRGSHGAHIIPPAVSDIASKFGILVAKGAF